MKKLIAIAAVAFALSAHSLSAEWPSIATGWHEIQVPASGVFDPSTGTFFAPTVTTNNLTISALATPTVTSVTPVLTRVGSITTVAGGWRATGLLTAVAKANLLDGETFVLSDGTNIPQSFEFDVAGDGVTGGRVAVDVSGATTAVSVAAICATAINATTSGTFTYEAIDNLNGTVTLRNTTWLASGTSPQSETVADAGFILTNMTGGSDGVADGDYFTVKYDTGLTVPIEFDASPGNGTSGGRIPLIFTGTSTADDIRDAIIAILNAAAPTALTASSGGAATVAITLDVPGNAGDTNTENVANAGFTVTGFSVIAATTYGYKVVSFLADGTSTAASPEVTTVAGHATLSATDYIVIAWAPSVGSSYSKVYRTTGGAAPPKLLYSGTYVTLVDNGIAGIAETPATTNTTGTLTVGSLTAGRVATVGTGGRLEDDAGITYDAGTDTLTVGKLTSTGMVQGLYYVQADNTLSLYNGGLILANSGTAKWTNDVSQGATADSGLRRVSAGLVGVTSGGSNLGSLQAGNVTAVGLGQVVGVTTVPQGANDGVTYGYIVVPYLNDGTYGTPSAQGVTLVGATALSATDKNTITWSALTNAAYYGVFRTSGGATNGLIGTTTALTFDDTGIVGGTGVPTTNTTGRVLVGDGSALAPSVAFASSPEMGLFKLSTYRLAIGAAGASAQIWDYANGQVFIPDNWLFGWGSNDASITRPAAGVNQFGNFPNATPQPRTIIVGESGSGTDIAGANGVIQSGAGTGSVAGSTLTFKTPTATTPGTTTAQTQNTRLSLREGHVNIPGLTSYANNAAALVGGLVAGDLYTITGSDPLALAVVY